LRGGALPSNRVASKKAGETGMRWLKIAWFDDKKWVMMEQDTVIAGIFAGLLGAFAVLAFMAFLVLLLLSYIGVI
jgi:hypothetical protein